MKCAWLGFFLLLATAASAHCQEVIEVPPPVGIAREVIAVDPLARLGLSSMCLVPDEAVDAMRCPSPPAPGLILPPVIYGERQLYTLTHGYVRDSLPRKALRWSQRTRGF